MCVGGDRAESRVFDQILFILLLVSNGIVQPAWGTGGAAG